LTETNLPLIAPVRKSCGPISDVMVSIGMDGFFQAGCGVAMKYAKGRRKGLK
jgi:hypothetical protein